MTPPISIRKVQSADLPILLDLENTCFQTDRLSRRSFQRFVRHGSHDLLVAELAQEIVGYVLVLYRAGTSLARLYSIAVLPRFQGRRIASQLIEAAEEAGRQSLCAFMRLEVSVNNVSAFTLYKKLGYRDIGRISGYYEDGSDAIRMERRIHAGDSRSNITAPYFQQSTDFTCGPAALMMAMQTLRSEYQIGRREELQIWREATTVFMTSGHGGCSPYGLALSAWRRGFHVQLYINQEGTPFLDGVRNLEKKAVVEFVHQDFLESIRNTQIQLLVQDISPDELLGLLRSGHAIVALISTWRLNRNKAPHWVFIAGIDEHFVYVNDPDTTEGWWESETDYIQLPIRIPEFIKMATFGQSRLRCLLIISNSPLGVT